MRTIYPIREHFHSFEGSLYRHDGSHALVRTNYAQHHTAIATTADLKACLRAGPYVWPGGYALAFYTRDGAALCFDCVRNNLADVVFAIRNDARDGWRVDSLLIECDVDSAVDCDQCNAHIFAGDESPDIDPEDNCTGSYP